MRPTWTGAIGFGLVNIPVKLYSAVVSTSLDLDMLDKKDLANIKFKRVNEKTGKEVDWENIVKGFKIDDQYVVLEDEDFENAAAVKTKIIEITDFVNSGEIDKIYYEMPYYVAPESTGRRAYALLREALLKTDKVGVATFVMRNKEGLAVLEATEKVIMLHRLRFHEEIKDSDDLDIPEKSELKGQELKMATLLIEQLSSKFDITKFKDTYTSQLLNFIHEKAKGVHKPAPQMQVVHSKAKDLMEQLQASLQAKKSVLQKKQG